MRLNKRKTVLGILTGFLLFAIILIIILFSKSNEATPNTVDDAQKTKKNPQSSVIYGEVTKEDLALQDKQYEENKEVHEPEDTSKTIFETKKDTSKLGSYNLSQPIIVENSNFPGMSRKIIGNYNGYIFMYRNANEILYYDPSKKETFSLTDGVTKAFPSFNTPYILFEKESDKGYTLYSYDFIKNTDGFEEIVKTANSAIDFGRQGEFNYFAIQEQPNTYFYQPIPKSSFEAEEIGFRDFVSNSVQPYKDYVISYSKSDNSLYKLQFGKSPQKLFGLPNYSDLKYLVHFKVNPFRTDKLIYIASFSNIDGDLTGKKVIINGTTCPDLQNITNVEWIDGESILYTIDSEAGELQLYNFRTAENYVLAKGVSTFTYNYKDKSIYYNETSDNVIKKITINQK
ncbi:hypothetical protein [Bacillus thuringiensis]|uniref:hypothetical protein n=1 Tax=Bacillus thuringiensis TaxID=1428 RepID=UPI0021D64C0F|nr:hypothetical protein [Bacillus thuringiensis]MCU7666996.1 hypothetical protein [Bacillus thuringiensis]